MVLGTKSNHKSICKSAGFHPRFPQKCAGNLVPYRATLGEIDVLQSLIQVFV